MKKHKIASLCVLGLVAGLLVLALAGLSLSASPPKATGGVGFTAPDDDGNELERRIEFNAHAEHNGRPAKGNLNYRDANGDWFKMDIQCVTILYDSSFAFFSGPIVAAGDTTWLGQWLLIAVHDGGTPGKKGDHVWGEMYGQDPGCDLDHWPGEAWAVENGNLVIH